jgi:carboxymethylenebutenolidase
MGRLAVGGYCQTGRHPLLFAAEVPISAVVVWYGAAAKREWVTSPRQPGRLEDAVAKLSCPVFGSFGSDDHIIAVDDVQHFRNVLEKHGKSYDLHIYKGAPHGWLNDTMPGRYRKEQAEAGWAAQQKFLTRVLGTGYRNDVIEWAFDCAFSRDYDFSKNVRLE